MNPPWSRPTHAGGPHSPLRASEGDVVVIGAGAAGASAALAAAAGGRRVIVLIKGRLGDGCTPWAQGGLAAALHPADSAAAHGRDTLLAGVGLCDPYAVRTLVNAAPEAIASLQSVGAVFDPAIGPGPGARGLALTREGGHRRNRIAHAGGDATGAEISRALTQALSQAPLVQLYERTVAVDPLLDGAGRMVGVSVVQLDEAGAIAARGEVRARAVVLATGGFGQAYAATTNPDGVTGDGLLLALRAGATVADVEFVQFHPTVLWRGPAARGQQVLVSEAVRGEGAVLVDSTGRPIMAGVHPLADLAPRDVVSAALHAHLSQASGPAADHVWLDATGLGRELLERRFPTIVAACRAAGIDPVREPIPVAPGAHYACGGVRADMSGRTGVPGLFAVGEVAATGVHGANRLASNSLTEGLIAGRRAGQLLARALPAGGGSPVSTPVAGPAVTPASRTTMAQAMTRHAGVLRSASGLAELLSLLADLPRRSDVLGPTSLAELEARALHLVSTVVAMSANSRHESRGCHRRADFPDARPELARQQLIKLVGGRLDVRTARSRQAA